MISKSKNAILLVLLSAFSLAWMVGCLGCRTTKNLEKEKIVVDSSVVRQRDSLVNLIVELKDSHVKEIQELFDGLVIFDNDCDTVIIDKACNIDSALQVLKALKNKVKILSDGTIEAEGNIKSAKSHAAKTDKEATELSIRYEKLIKVNDSLAAKLKKQQSTKTKEVVRKSGGVFTKILFVIAFVLGCFAEYKFKIVSKVLNLVSKLKK